jgi:hypothetical protein
VISKQAALTQKLMAAANSPDKAAAPDTKRKIEVALTAAAIAAIIVKRAAINITQREGRALARMTPCGMAEHAAGRAPIRDRAGLRRFCYPSDVTAAMIRGNLDELTFPRLYVNKLHNLFCNLLCNCFFRIDGSKREKDAESIINFICDRNEEFVAGPFDKINLCLNLGYSGFWLGCDRQC